MQVLGLLISGPRPKGHGTHNAPLFSSTRGSCSSSRGKILCFRTPSMENWRLLMLICSKVPMCPDGVTNVSSEIPPLYIRGRTSKVHEVTNGLLFYHTKPFLIIVISSLTRVHKLVKVERLWREAFRGLYVYSSLMDIVCLKMMFVLPH